MSTIARPEARQASLPERLGALAGLAAALASLVGFIPGVYRDPGVVIAQSHGYDAGNLAVVLVLGLGLAWSVRGSLRGRLVAIGALGCLVYGYITYAFVIVLNPATLLYIAVLGLGGWSFATGLARIDQDQVETSLNGRLARRTTAVFLIVVALLFGANWLSQIAGSAVSGKLPSELAANGWPMNPVYVLDLGFVVPLLLLAGFRLLRHRPGGAGLAVSLLVFVPLLAASILLMATSQALDGQALQAPMVAIFVVIASVSALLAWLALRQPRRPTEPRSPHSTSESRGHSPAR